MFLWLLVPEERLVPWGGELPAAGSQHWSREPPLQRRVNRSPSEAGGSEGRKDASRFISPCEATQTCCFLRLRQPALPCRSSCFRLGSKAGVLAVVHPFSRFPGSLCTPAHLPGYQFRMGGCLRFVTPPHDRRNFSASSYFLWATSSCVNIGLHICCF